MYTSKGLRGMARAFMGVGWVGIAASLLFSICNVCFSTSVVYTDAANTLVIVASSTEGQFRFNSTTLLGAPTSPPSHDGGRGPPISTLSSLEVALYYGVYADLYKYDDPQ